MQASIVPCNADCLAHVTGIRQGETTGEDNLKTLALVYGAYEAARTGQVVEMAKD